MALSRLTYPGTGAQVNFTVSFPYILKAHVQVRVDGILKVDGVDYTWTTASQITFSVAPANLASVTLVRDSNPITRAVTFEDGSILTADVENLSAKQMFYLVQESLDTQADLSAKVDQFQLGGTAPLASNIASTPTGDVAASTVQTAIAELSADKVAKAGDTMSGPLILAADPAVALGAATKQYVDGSVFPGFVGISFTAAAPTGWLNLQGGTIGNAASGAGARANADTAALFAYLWNNLSNSVAPVSGGRGANAAADFAANKTITLPDWRNRKPMGAGQSTFTEAFTQAAVNTGTDTIAVASNDRQWNTAQPAVINILTGSLTGTGISNGATVYVIRTGPTSIKLATSLANAQNGVAIDLTAVGGSSTFTLVATFTSRTVGEMGGEEQHAESSVEQLSHNHATLRIFNAGGVTSGILNSGANTFAANDNAFMGLTGGNQAMNVLDPYFCVNWIIKL